ncbi:porin [Bacteroides zoogleoformans]|uniref:Porin n=1 Tax=Bacteroides zoogleoformans TaxID=28119 RepID=A0ABM6TB73_9BACE|nr:porin [Bacteroides zoogleoformans]AVM53880.1 porin [Bacteroides zoogleoformans]
MRRYLLSCSVIFFTPITAAQETNLNKAINTFKERITLSGYAQVGYTYTDKTPNKENSFGIKRAILLTNGKITDKWSAFFMYSFGSTGKILEAYTEYHFLPQFNVRLGQFKTPYSIENPLSSCIVEQINSNAQAVAYLAGTNGSDPLYGATTGRDAGLLIYGDLLNKLINYKFAVMNGQGINLKDKNNQKDIVGSLMLHPLNWLSVGGSFIKGKGCAIAVSPDVPDIKVGENYTRNRWAVGAVVTTKPVSLRTEYLAGKDEKVRSGGYYATASIHVLPKTDIVVSYDYFNKNKTLDSKQTNYMTGIQWWFYPKCRLQVQYIYCHPHKRESYNLLQTQVQVRF